MAKDDERSVEVDGREVRISRPDKVYFPALDATKFDLVGYYLSIADHLMTRDLDYRDLFTTRRTFVTATLARIYRIPPGRPDGGW